MENVEIHVVRFYCKYCDAILAVRGRCEILGNRDHIFCPSCVAKIEDFDLIDSGGEF
jgi:RNase P subunit RPR2